VCIDIDFDQRVETFQAYGNM